MAEPLGSLLAADLLPLPAGLLWGALGALGAAALAGALLIARRAARRRRAAAGAGHALDDLRRLEHGLREFAREVEGRLDVKLDRLELLVREGERVLCGLELYADALAGAVLAGDGRHAEEEDEPPPRDDLPARAGVEQFGGRLQPSAPPLAGELPASGPPPRRALGAITSAERERVLALARAGKGSESISETVGLRRGEVDLILGLQRIAERRSEAAGGTPDAL
jgi:hypothetical protein